MIKNGFILFPHKELKPDIKLSPFTSEDIKVNRNLPDSNKFEEYLKNRFCYRNFTFTINGRHAIQIALNQYELKQDDYVTILTSTGNRYVSGCVTREIEKKCKWSRKVEDRTKVIFIIHEFGYPFSFIQEIINYGIPIIEDCAYSFNSYSEEFEIGTIGDFTIYSFPKYFPIQIGGMLVSNKRGIITNAIDIEAEKYIKNVLSFHIDKLGHINAKRWENYYFLKDEFLKIGLIERFSTKKNISPGVFMFKDHDEILNLNDLKLFFFTHGIECSVFYGEQSFFLPVHQRLGKDDLLYFIELIKYFKANSNGNIQCNLRDEC
jgi:hypothetical protein